VVTVTFFLDLVMALSCSRYRAGHHISDQSFNALNTVQFLGVVTFLSPFWYSCGGFALSSALGGPSHNGDESS